MPLYVKNNALLKVGSSLSAGSNCCCGASTCGNFFHFGTCAKCSDFGYTIEEEQDCKDVVDAYHSDPSTSCTYKWIGTTAQCLCNTTDTECELIQQTNNTVWSQYQTKTKSCGDGIPGNPCTSVIWCPCESEPPCPPGTFTQGGQIYDVYQNALDCSNLGDPVVFFNCGSRSADAGVGPFCNVI